MTDAIDTAISRLAERRASDVADRDFRLQLWFRLRVARFRALQRYL